MGNPFISRPLQAAPQAALALDSTQAERLGAAGAMSPLLIDARAACALLSIGYRKLAALTSVGAIPSDKIGTLRRYRPDELKAWVRAGCPTEPGAGMRIRQEATE